MPETYETLLLEKRERVAIITINRPDKQDYEGTGITVKVAQGLEVPRLLIVVNKTPPVLDATR